MSHTHRQGDVVVRRDAGLAEAVELLGVSVAELQRLQQDATRQSNRRLRDDRLRLLGKYAEAIMHDLNNFIAATHSASALLRRRVETPAAGEILDHLDRTIARGAQLTRQLFDLASENTEVAVVDLAELLQNDVAVLRQVAGSGVELRWRCEGTPGRVLLARSYLRSALFDLIAARGDTPGAARTIDITVSARLVDGAGAPRHHVVVEIAGSNGPGAATPPDGLSAATDLTEMCGGWVEVADAGAHGASPRQCIRLVMPASPAMGRDLAGHAQAPATILLVGHGHGLCSYLAELLRTAGHRVVEAANPAVALNIATTQPFAVIVSVGDDNAAGDADTERDWAELAILLPGVPLIALGNGSVKSTVQLTKPIDEIALLETIARLAVDPAIDAAHPPWPAP